MAAGDSAGVIYAEAALDISGFEASIFRMNGDLQDFARRLESALGGEETAAALAARGLSAAEAFGAGFRSYSFAADAAAVTAAIASALAPLASRGTALGRGFSQGLAAGIQAGRSGVISAAASVASAAIQAAQARLQIHSPSRVTEGFGADFDLGFARGVLKELPEVDRAVRQALAVRPAQAASDGGQGAERGLRVQAAPIDYDRLAEAMDRRQIVLSMNGRRVARAQAEDNALEQARRERAEALGYLGRR